MNRRGFLGAMLAAASAPAIVRAESLMKIIVPAEKEIILSSQFAGWDYELGDFSTHEFYMGEGGPRFDRAVIPSVIGYYVLVDSHGVPLISKTEIEVPRLTTAQNKKHSFFS